MSLHGRSTFPVGCRHDSLVFQSDDRKQYETVIYPEPAARRSRVSGELLQIPQKLQEEIGVKHISTVAQRAVPAKIGTCKFLGSEKSLDGADQWRP